MPPSLAIDEIIVWAHDRNYWEDLKHPRLTQQHIRRIGFPLSEQLVQREIIIAQGTIDCCHLAMKQGMAMNVAGAPVVPSPTVARVFLFAQSIWLRSNSIVYKGSYMLCVLGLMSRDIQVQGSDTTGV